MLQGLKERIIQNKKLILITGSLVLFVGAAAFVAGRMLNQKVVPVGSGGPIGSVQIVPAQELPKIPPEEEGLFVGRQDNIILVETDQPGGGGVFGSPVGIGGGPKVEVVVTIETILYLDTTQPPLRRPSGDDPRVLQQTVGEGTLDDLNSQSLVRVWGRKSGDRIIAEVLFYSNPVVFKRP